VDGQAAAGMTGGGYHRAEREEKKAEDLPVHTIHSRTKREELIDSQNYRERKGENILSEGGREKRSRVGARIYARKGAAALYTRDKKKKKELTEPRKKNCEREKVGASALDAN